MKNWSTAMLCSFFLVFCGSSFSVADTIPKIPFFKQEQRYWCWAATSQVILKFYVPGFNKTQRELANTFGTNNGTSNTDTLPKVKIPLLIEKYALVNTVQHITAELLFRPLTWEEAKILADQQLPFIIIYHYPSPTSRDMYHCVVFGGYIKDSTRIKIVDPDQLNGTPTYERSYKKLTTGNIASECVWQQTILPHKATAILAKAGFLSGTKSVLHLQQNNGVSHLALFGFSESETPTQLSLFLPNGKLLFNTSAVQGSGITLPSLGAGNYVVRFQTDQRSYVKMVSLVK